MQCNWCFKHLQENGAFLAYRDGEIDPRNGTRKVTRVGRYCSQCAQKAKEQEPTLRIEPELDWQP